jgi:uncharacterized protein (DUF697 family)
VSDNLQSIILGGFLLLCLLPLVIVAIIGFLAWRAGRDRINDFLDPSVERLQSRFNDLKQKNPSASDEELIGRIIRRQAFLSGIVGAVTGFGGFVTLPIGLPIDILASLYLQAGLVNFIAAHYGQKGKGDWEGRVRGYLIVSGGGQVTQTTSKALIGFLVRVIGKSLSKLVPFLGAAISFAVNYAIAQAIGQVALRWYGRGKIPNPGAQPA